jgi:hypothetical protein
MGPTMPPPPFRFRSANCTQERLAVILLPLPPPVTAVSSEDVPTTTNECLETFTQYYPALLLYHEDETTKQPYQDNSQRVDYLS